MAINAPVAVSVIVVTKNEAHQIAGCLKVLSAFDDVWVVDSNSRDGTAECAETYGANVTPYTWNGQYPKKRQWCLENLPLKYDWVLFVDADEILSSELINEIDGTIKSHPDAAGFFVTGRYSVGGKILRFGIPNRKIVLFHKHRMEFPVVDDLDIPGMGEIEGHYQPVLKKNSQHMKIGTLKSAMIHFALDDDRAWMFRHEKYARWEAGMNEKNAWPIDPIPWRQRVKTYLRMSRFRPELVFFVCFFGKLGFLDGSAGLDFARKKAFYYQMIKVIAKSKAL